MTFDLDIYRTANTLIRHYGEAARLLVCMRCDEMRDKGDLNGRDVRLRVIRAIIAGDGAAGGREGAVSQKNVTRFVIPSRFPLLPFSAPLS